MQTALGFEPTATDPVSGHAGRACQCLPDTGVESIGADEACNADLLARVLGGRRALELAASIISEFGGLADLRRASVEDLVAVSGVGRGKACALVAAMELGARATAATLGPRPVVSSPADVDALLRPRLAHLDRENFVVVLLNTKNRVIGSPTISVGTLSSSLVHPREVFKPAVKAGAASLILAHNHPSGAIDPSREDRTVTSRLVEAGELFGIEILDHVIIADGYFSMKEHGMLVAQ